MSDEMLKDMNQGGTDQHQALAERIIAEAAKQNVKAEIKINQIPAHVAANILEFLKRVELKGMEAIAWGEAFSHMQQYVTAPQQQPGVPFGGLPGQKK
jgi:hypothetical protein